MVHDKNSKFNLLLLLSLCIFVNIGVFSLFLYQTNILHQYKFLTLISGIAFAFLFCEIFCLLLYWCIHHQIKNGLKYAITHARLEKKIRKQLIDCESGFGVINYFGKERVAIIPKIKLYLDKNLNYGQVILTSHIKYSNRLENIDLSPALNNYIVIEQYFSDDMNSIIFEIEDSSVNNHLTFESYKDLQAYSKRQGDYMLVIDKKYSVPLSSLLITGSVGSGKTYALYGLLGCMMSWSIKPILYLADPKNSSLYTLAYRIMPERAYGTPENIVNGLDIFYDKMLKRQIQIQKLLHQKLDSDYREFNLQPLVFIIDEMSAFISVVNGYKKDVRDRVHMILRQIVLMGRQLGCFLWVLQQKSDASDLPTAIRDNLIFKVCLGNVPRTTYITTFETSDIPPKKLKSGEGYFTYMGLTRDPQFISFPTLNFNILKEFIEANN